MRAMNLLPVEERGGTRSAGAGSRLTAVHALAGAGAVVAVGMLGTYALAKKDTASAREAEAAAVARSASAQAQVNRLAPVVAFDARRQARETAVLALAAGRTDWAGVLSATAGSLPSNVTVTTLKLQAADATGAATSTAATPTGLAGTGGTVTLNVCADTQPRVATTLRRFRALPQVADVALSQTARTGSSSGGSSSSAGGGAGCSRVSADATLGLSDATVIDGATAAAAGTAAAGTAAPGAATTTGSATTSSAPTTTGTSR
jgi:hypothetical protein